MFVFFSAFSLCVTYYGDSTILMRKERNDEQLTPPRSSIIRQEFTIENFLTIPSNFLKNNNVVKYLILNNIQNINENAFSGCSNLEQVDLNSGYTVSIGSKAFYSCVKLSVFNTNKKCSLSSSCFESCQSLTKIINSTNLPSKCYYNCSSLTSVTIYPDISSVGNLCFGYCLNLAMIYIEPWPGRSIDFSGDSFENCLKFKTLITYRDFYPSYSYRFPLNFMLSSIENLTFVADQWRYILRNFGNSFPNVINLNVTIREIDRYAFYGCKNLTSVVLTNVSYIDNEAFSQCTSLQNIEMPNIQYISNSAFSNCYNLQSFNLSSEIRTIDELAFYNCTSLEEIYISSNTTLDIGVNAFKQCENLRILNLSSSSDLKLRNNATVDCNSLIEVYLSSGSRVTIQNTTFYNCMNLTKVYIASQSNLTIGVKAFAELQNLQEFYIRINTSIKPVIGISAFESCAKLKTIQSNVLCELSDRTFYGCSSLLNILDSTTIPTRCYERCNSLQELHFSNNLNSINGNAFRSCISLHKLVLPSSLQEIGGYAFRDCSNLAVVLFEKYTSELNIARFDPSFDGCHNIQILKIERPINNLGAMRMSDGNSNQLFIGNNVLTFPEKTSFPFYRPSFERCKFKIIQFEASKNSINIDSDFLFNPKNIETLIVERPFSNSRDIRKFYNAVNLKIDNFPKLEHDQFSEFSDLRSIIIGNHVDSIGDSAFENKRTLEEVRLGSNLKKIGDSAFMNCPNLRYVDTHNINEIGIYCFCNCYSLTNIIIPPTLSLVSSYSFCNTSITKIMFNYETTVESNAFNNCKQLKTIEAFDYCVFEEDSFKFCDNIKSVVFYEYVSFRLNTFSNITNISFYYYGFNDYCSYDTSQELIRLGISGIHVLKGYSGTKYGNIAVKCNCNSTSTESNPEKPRPVYSYIVHPCSEHPFYSSAYRMAMKIRRN